MLHFLVVVLLVLIVLLNGANARMLRLNGSLLDLTTRLKASLDEHVGLMGHAATDIAATKAALARAEARADAYARVLAHYGMIAIVTFTETAPNQERCDIMIGPADPRGTI